VIDAHNHILPGMDDGARDPAYALDMARIAVGAGIHTVIATPHHLNGVYVNSRKAILRAVMELRSALAQAAIELAVYPGSELHLIPELPSRILDGDALTYADRGRAALVELPKQTIPQGAENILEKLLYEGITPVIAHPERNATLAAHPERAEQWVRWGCKLQLTAQSCAGDFGAPIQAVCRRWCESGAVHLLASDAHRTQTRPPDLRGGIDAVIAWIGTEAAELMTLTNPRRLLDGEALLSVAPAADARRGLMDWFRQLRARPN